MMNKIHSLDQFAYFKDNSILVRSNSKREIVEALQLRRWNTKVSFFKIDFINPEKKVIGISATEYSIPLLARPFQVERCIYKWGSMIEESQWWVLYEEIN